MAIHFLSRSVPKTLGLASFLSRSLSTATTSSLSSAHSRSTLSLINRLRPLAGAIASAGKVSPAAIRCFATNATTCSLRDPKPPKPNWSNRPPNETILLDGCDFEHWLVVMEPPEEGATRDEIIDGFIKTLAMVVGSEEEARHKIYSVSTRCYFAFGALVSEEVSYKLKELPKVRWVLPDSYLNVKNKDYGGEPFIDGRAVPYDPKYHEEWIRNSSRANERNRRNDRPKNFDKNFPRRRENMQSRDFQNRGPPPMPNQPGQSGPNMAGPPNNMSPPNNMPPSPPNRAPMPPNNMSAPNNYNNVQQPSNNWGGGQPNYNQMPPNNYNQMPPNNYNQVPPNNYNQVPPNNYNQMPPNNMRGPPPPPPNMGALPPQNMPQNMGRGQPAPSWSDPAQYQNNYTPERDNGGPNRY